MLSDNHLTSQILTSSIAGLIAFLGVVITNRANYKRLKLEHDLEEARRQLEIKRERGEELYEISHKWIFRLLMHALSITSVMEGKISYNQHLTMYMDANKNTDYKFERLEMLVDVYFPQVRNAYNTLIQGRMELNSIIAEHKRAYEIGQTDGTRFLEQFLSAQQRVSAAGDQFKHAIKQCLQAA